MLRIHFTEQDLARTRLAATSGPFVETCAAFSLLHRGAGATLFDGWREVTRTRMTPQAYQLAGLLSRRAKWSVELWTLGGAPVDSLDQPLDTIQSSPKRLSSEVVRAGSRFQLPRWARDLAVADRDALRELDVAIRAVHDAAVAPYWPRIRAHHHAVHAASMQAFRDGGLARVLEQLHPAVHWRPPVLEVPTRYDHGDFHLEGQGLIIAPTVFGWPFPHGDTAPLEPGAPNVLYIPTAISVAAPSWAAWISGQDSFKRASELMGRTRAIVLDAVADHGPCTTSQLAARIGLPVSSTSEHATILRNAGLIATRRDRNKAWHTLTAVGAAVLNGPA
ncbi:winged helix-turn-helix domain-containing protein [Yinghuangia soli]|uniref:Winged helix-turn-helix domain-containing protein n=1 Tax=Yinghuangia soli TaxID=2908204 RepID=A0AA41Q3K0_9ACTN|nr:winged helix-turn-helix domain-containing protein [Yinghuangia soli]MCF2530898.1 winged helix-turn-helix domain-containing protein [Yinghuangia soli]